ncbi:response regulator [Alphaproteobacteria bacterium KMM 3653]|uniref:Response regulator n=1 Tax=Harenicola maris TaxID=2841044 RepID=A0AAP2CNJ2_9RHOB|nr:response regulator [Harenicola maris]
MKLLAVDDDPILLSILEQMISESGDHTITTTQNPLEAIKLARSANKPFDCFLLDIEMPEMDGIELCAELRKLGKYRKTPILMITAMSEKHHIDAAFNAGATDYINKPLEQSELRARLSLVSRAVNEGRNKASKIFAVNALKNGAGAGQDAKTPLHEPFDIEDVTGVIEVNAFENYLRRLSRSALFGSTVFAFSIQRISELHAELSTFDFKALMADVSEAISDCLSSHQYLMTYAGGGTFICVTEGGWIPKPQDFTEDVHHALRKMDLFSGKGERLIIRLAAGDMVRLSWRPGDGAISAIGEAHISAERRAAHLANDLLDPGLWYAERTA